MKANQNGSIDSARVLNEQVLGPMKNMFVGKDEVIDLLGVCLVARENLFILGPPGTAKSALVQTLAKKLQGTIFDYLLTQFTEPNEIFGPFDIRQLREGNLVTNTEGMLPEATFVFLDELLNANSAILNSLLMVLNERVFRRGRETRSLPTLLVVGASNRLPEDEALEALFDRFPLRVQCDNVQESQLNDVLRAGWQLENKNGSSSNGEVATLSVESIEALQRDIGNADLQKVLGPFAELVTKLRTAGLPISDRRAVKLQRLIAASAYLCGRTHVEITDLWVLRYVWDNIEQQSLVNTIVQSYIDNHVDENMGSAHPRAARSAPDADQLALDIDNLIEQATGEAEDLQKIRDQLGILAASCAWVSDASQRGFLEEKIQAAWKTLDE